MTLRRRLLRYLVLASIASCALTVATGSILVRHRIAAQRSTALQAEADVLAAVGGAPGALALGAHVYRVGQGGPRRLAPMRAAAVLSAIPPASSGQGSTSVGGRPFIYAVRPTTSGRVVLIRAAHVAFSEWRPFLGSLLLAGLGGALLAVALSYVLARALTDRFDELSAATRRLASGAEEVRVPVSGDKELADLAVAFNEMSARLTGARASQRRFLESVSHELKTPLTSIRGYAEALEENAVEPGEGARVIGAEADRLDRLVGDLLELARFGRDDFSVAMRQVDLNAVARQAVERHLPRARESALALTSEVPESALALGDADRILQATSNLVENALRMTPAGGAITVATAEGMISVRDTGPGLAAGDLPRAFERFYLHRRYASERPVGSGLGLAVVEQLATAMGGTVHAESPPAGGALFAIRLPSRFSTPQRSDQRDAHRPSA